MLKIKKQINLLYITSMLGNLSVTGAWVAILAARGFSLVEIGFAETVFHITSLICEIPSGILADIYGRKKMLLVSHMMAIIGNTIMVFSNGIGMVCLSFVFHALMYNFASGSGDALAYDSLKSVKQESRYEKYFSNQLIIYRIGTAVSTLCAGMALFMGYRLAYVISAFWHVPILLLTMSLVEVKIETKDTERKQQVNRILRVMVFGGFISAMADDALQVRTDAKLQDMFPSEQRATLISMGSFTFSVIMIVLSPLAGYFFSIW